MAKPINHERDKEIVRKIEKEGWTFRRVAKHYNISVGAAHLSYARVRYVGVQLSTA